MAEHSPSTQSSTQGALLSRRSLRPGAKPYRPRHTGQMLREITHRAPPRLPERPFISARIYPAALPAPGSFTEAGRCGLPPPFSPNPTPGSRTPRHGRLQPRLPVSLRGRGGVPKAPAGRSTAATPTPPPRSGPQRPAAGGSGERCGRHGRRQAGTWAAPLFAAAAPPARTHPRWPGSPGPPACRRRARRASWGRRGRGPGRRAEARPAPPPPPRRRSSPPFWPWRR